MLSKIQPHSCGICSTTLTVLHRNGERSGSRFEILRRFEDTKLAQKGWETHCMKALGLSMPFLLFSMVMVYTSAHGTAILHVCKATLL